MYTGYRLISAFNMKCLLALVAVAAVVVLVSAEDINLPDTGQ
jgi:hypothetical protein